MTVPHDTFAALAKEIAASYEATAAWMRGHRIETPEEAANAKAKREALAELRARVEAARDDERLPLIKTAQAVQARYAPKLMAIKQADDLVRHALKAWNKRQRDARRGTP